MRVFLESRTKEVQVNMEQKILKEIDVLLNKLSENDPKAFEDAIKIKAEIRTLVRVLTL